jgi:hypothetical protein
MLNTGTQKHTLRQQRDELQQQLAGISLRMRGQQLPIDNREQEIAVEHPELPPASARLRHRGQALMRSAI